MVLFGDTGCRTFGPVKWENRQACNEHSWPFQRIVSRAAAGPGGGAAPGLVIHLGDYTYGETESWDVWRREFFEPAKHLLETTPWIMLPGNHEACGFRDNPGRHGWRLFLDHTPVALTRSCSDTPELLPPYALDINRELRLIVLDSANPYVTKDDKEYLPVFERWFEQSFALCGYGAGKGMAPFACTDLGVGP